MLDSFGKWVIYFVVIAATITIGWNQPLRYRFMSKADIDLIEHPEQPPTPRPRPSPTPSPTPPTVKALPTPTPVPWMFDPNRRSSLDRGNYDQRSTGSSSYFDRTNRGTQYPR